MICLAAVEFLRALLRQIRVSRGSVIPYNRRWERVLIAIDPFKDKKGRRPPFATSHIIGRENRRSNNVPGIKKQWGCRLSGSSQSTA